VTRADRGALAPAITVIALFLMLLAGLVADSARIVDARSRAGAYAEEAARAGAQRIDLNSERVRLDTSAAVAAVQRYCAAAGAGEPRLVECATVAASSTRIEVRARIDVPMSVLGIIGIASIGVTGTGSATSQQGVTGVDTYPGVPPPEPVITEVPLPVPTGTPRPDPLPEPAPTPSSGPSASPTAALPAPDVGGVLR
jgi:hypothetical protein